MEGTDATVGKRKTPLFSPPSHPNRKLGKGTLLAQGGLSSHMAAGKVRDDVLLDPPDSEFVIVHHTVKVRNGDSGGSLVDEEGNLVAINTGQERRHSCRPESRANAKTDKNVGAPWVGALPRCRLYRVRPC